MRGAVASLRPASGRSPSLRSARSSGFRLRRAASQRWLAAARLAVLAFASLGVLFGLRRSRLRRSRGLRVRSESGGSALALLTGMSRDHTKLRVFHLADALAFDIYKATKKFPREERFGLQSQIRRAALSVPTNIVEGSARLTQKAYCNFCDIALGSACETRYLLEFSWRLEYFDQAAYTKLKQQADAVVKSLSRLVGVLDAKHRDRRLARLQRKTDSLDSKVRSALSHRTKRR
jgi:four helix bundle protein